MTRINLLPWREEQAERRRKYFLVFLLVSALIALATVWLADRIIGQAIDRQVARNNHLSKVVTVLDSRIKTIDELREQRRQLMERMKVVEDLQGDRSAGGQLFDQLARAVPDGVRLREITVSGTSVEISATAASNHDVARLMRSLESSNGLQTPSLRHVRAEEAGSAFQLMVGHGESGEAGQ
ncbi:MULTISPECIES: PilN domain-containing protein [unclassified Pseudomonas]|uniref:PilN domain-containing protein n=1 Tax=unclassified Pseudomonas TaxID=196821 RepID=UPI0011EDBEEE|nr:MULTISPECIES: PilN domain-containing protein [unclassified Pseudomonas]KAA0949059.1 PilN domain-containing protein [Pseudomonas sp. ANT_H4]KAA0954163.1 PilN domain-containing protein [Pseudomonas sp. ANT_H14]